MNRRLEAIDSEILNCRVSAESFKHVSLPSTHIHYATFFRYAIPEFVQEDRVLYLDCDMIFTQDLSPLFEVDLGGFSYKSRCPYPSKRAKPSSKMVRMAIWFLIARLWMKTYLFLRWRTKLYLP